MELRPPGDILGVAVHPWTQEFVDRDLERAYRDDVHETAVAPFATPIIAAMVGFLVTFGLVDRLVIPDALDVAWTLRYGVLLPTWLVVLAATRAPWFRRVATFGAFYVSTSLTVAFVIAAFAADPPGSWMYVSLTAVMPIAVPLARWKIRVAAPYVLIPFVLTVVFIVAEGDLGSQVVAFLIGFHVVGAFWGMAAGVTVDGITRRVFIAQQRADAERRRADDLLLNILPLAIADRLKEGEEAIADDHDDVAVVFADLVGFTRLSRTQSPAEVVAFLTALFAAFDDLAVRHGCEKIKTVGDAWMAVAGLPESHPAPAEAAVALALDLLAAADQLVDPRGDPVRLRIGVHVGPVVAGVIGRQRFSYDLWGDTVNLASRMESQGVAGAVQVTTAVRDRLAERYDFEARGAIDVRGVGRRRTWLLRGGSGAGGA